MALLLLLGAGCAIPGPHFPEPEWGAAPPPYASELVELSFDQMLCQQRFCQRIITRFWRDGRATRALLTAGHEDSTQVGTIDPATFDRMAQAVVASGFFRVTWRDADHGPMAMSELLLSAAVPCRRLTSPTTFDQLVAKDSGAVSLDWEALLAERSWQRVGAGSPAR